VKEFRVKSIEDLQLAFSKAFSALVPAGYYAEVALLDRKGRKKRKDAAARNWDPHSGSVSITLKRQAPLKRLAKIHEEQSVAALPSPLAEAVNRDLPEVRQILESAPAADRRIFRPGAISGEALSDTIVRDRR
jgi:hypothetical protein